MLKIKSESKEDIIELYNENPDILIKINEIIIARYGSEGSFEFYGDESKAQFEGRWKK